MWISAFYRLWLGCLESYFPVAPHHVTRRNIRSMNVFYDDEDRDAYLELIQDQAESSGLDVPAWRLMSNHVHFIRGCQEQTGDKA